MDQPRVVQLLGRLLGALRKTPPRFDVSREILSEFIRNNATLPKVFLAIANRYVSLGRHEEAVSILTTGIDLHPENSHLLCSRGIAYCRIGDQPGEVAHLKKMGAPLELSIADLSRAYELDSDKRIGLVALCVRADILVRLSRFGEAIAAYETILRKVPKSARAHVGLGLVYAWMERIAMSKAHFGVAEEFLEDEESRNKLPYELRSFLEDRGSARIVWGEFEMSVQDFTGALSRQKTELFGHAAICHWRRAYAYCRLGLIEEARKDLVSSHSISPNFPLLPEMCELFPHLASDFELYLALMEECPATKALHRLLPTTDRWAERIVFLEDRITSL